MKIRTKIILVICVCTFVFNFPMIFLRVKQERNRETERLGDKIERTDALIESTSMESFWDMDKNKIKMNMDSFYRDEEIVGIYLKDVTGVISIKLDDKLSRSSGSQISKKFFIRKNKEILGKAEVIYTTGVLERRLKNVQREMVLLTLSSLLFVSVATYLIIIILLRPVNEIVQGLDMVDKGNFDYVLRLGTKDEFKVIEEYFNKMVSTIRNEIQSRIRNEQTLIKSEESLHIFKNLVEHSTDAIGMSTPGGRHYYQNEAFDRLFGEIGDRPHETVYVDNATGKCVFDTIMGGGGWQGEVKMYRKDRTVLDILLRAYAIKSQDGRVIGLVGLHTDITERKCAEEEIRRLNAELEQRVRERTAQLEALNKELEKFSYSVSHDLRAPLRSVDGFSLALLEDYGGKMDEPGRDYLRRIRKDASRMGQLIDDLLKLSRISRDTLVRKTVDLSVLARDVIAELQECDPLRHVEVLLAENLQVVADPGLVRVVLGNLLGNAWKFTSKTPQARIELGRLQTGSGQVPNDSAATIPATFFVRDNGVGFDMAYSTKLFDAFQRLHRLDEFPGSGVGLATVARIIHRHGGEIRAEGAIGQGATFFFTLGPASL